MKIKQFKPGSKYNFKKLAVWGGAFAAIGVAALILTHASPNSTMSLSSSTTQLANGSTLAVTVHVAAGPNEITGAQACVSYDATRLRLDSVDSSGSALHNPLPSDSSDCTAGQVQIRRYDTTPATGDFTLGVINFTVLNAGSTNASISFDEAKSFVNDNATTGENGDYVSILTGTTGIVLTPPVVNTPTANMSLNPATASLDQGASTSLTVKVSAGSNQITVAQVCVSYDTAKLSLVGVDVAGSALHSPLPAGSDDCPAGQVQISRYDTAPASGDFTLGVITFKAEQAGSTTSVNIDKATSFIRDNATTDNGGDYVNILSVVSGSTLTLNAKPVVKVPATLELSPKTANVINGENTTVTVKTSVGTNKITAAYICINYDAAKLTYVSTDTAVSPLKSDSQVSGSPECTGAGQIKFGREDTTPATGDFNLGVLTFKAKVANSTTDITIDDSSSLAPEGSQVSVLSGSTGSTLTLLDVPAEPITVSSSLKNGQETGGKVDWTATTTGGGVTKVEFYVNNNLKSTDTSAPYQYSLDTLALANGLNVLKVVAYNSAGNVNDTVSVTVKNGDTTVPSTPSGLSVSAPAYNKVVISWQASTDNTGVAGYWIIRDGKNLSKISATTTFTDTTVSANTSYIYQVIAFDSANNSSTISASKTIKTPSATVVTGVSAPSAPQNKPASGSNGTSSDPTPSTTTASADLSAPSVPTGLIATAVSSSQINLTWQASTDNVSIAGYEVYRVLDSNGTASKIASVKSASFGDCGLDSAKDYTYYVVAVDSANNTSAKSSTATTTTNATVTASMGSLTGRIASSDDIAVSMAKVVIIFNGLKHTYAANSDGVYTATNIPSSSYDITYTDLIHTPQTVKVTIPNSNFIIHNLTLKKK